MLQRSVASADNEADERVVGRGKEGGTEAELTMLAARFEMLFFVDGIELCFRCQ